MFRIFHRQIVRYALRHKTLALINILTVALGVAVYLAIQIANHSVIKAFQAGVDIVAGRAQLEARGTIDDAVFPRLQTVPGVDAATPLVEGFVTLPDYPGEYLRILGVDPFTDSEFLTFQTTEKRSDIFNGDAWFGDPQSIAITKRFADLHHIHDGQEFRIQVGEREETLRVSFTIDTTDSHIGVMDIGFAQELFASQGRLNAVLFRTRNSVKTVQKRIQELLPPDTVIRAPADRTEQVEQMLSGFQLNLTALSLVSLAVGMLLVYNTITASVVRRRGEIGILRALGVRREKIRWLFLGEAVLYGTIGCMLGCAGGIGLGRILVGTVSRTVSNLYVLVSIDRSYFPIEQVPLVFLLGICAVLMGAWIPAAAGANITPLRALNLGILIERSDRLSRVWLVYSALAFLLAFLLSYLAFSVNRSLGFVCALMTLLGFCALAPHATYWGGKGIGSIVRKIPTVSLAARNLVRSLYRHAATVGALASVIAMLVSITIMIHSFRETVNHWVKRRLPADIYLGPATNEVVGFQDFVSEEFLKILRSRPEIELIDTYRDAEITVGGSPVALGVTIGTTRNTPKFLGGDDQRKYQEYWRPDQVLVSEPLSRRLHLQEGQTIAIPTPQGLVNFRIAGVFQDFTRDSGLMLMQSQNFERYWHDNRAHSVAIYLKPGEYAERFVQTIRSAYPKASDYSIRLNRQLRSLVEDVLDQTFGVTQVLRLIAVFVAVMGIILNALVLVKEREREIGTLRAMGASRTRVGTLMLWESLFLGLVAVVLGFAAGVALAIVLTRVINTAFFGWTVPLSFPWMQLFLVPCWFLPVTVIAALLPARQAARTNLIDAIRM
jgi:putative ABC transport system permease protein